MVFRMARVSDAARLAAIAACLSFAGCFALSGFDFSAYGPVPAEGGAPVDAGTNSAADASPPVRVNCLDAATGSGCDPVLQCGCLTTETCSLQFNEDVLCVGAGTIDAGDVCKVTTQCRAGLVCTLELCRSFCSISEGCMEGRLCLGQIVSGSYGFCQTPCTLSDPASCGAPNVSCVLSQIVNAEFTTFCEVHRPVDPPNDPVDCAPGSRLVIGEAGVPRRCAKWCRIAKSDCVDSTCTKARFDPDFDEPDVLVDGVSWGACL